MSLIWVSCEIQCWLLIWNRYVCWYLKYIPRSGSVKLSLVVRCLESFKLVYKIYSLEYIQEYILFISYTNTLYPQYYYKHNVKIYTQFIHNFGKVSWQLISSYLYLFFIEYDGRKFSQRNHVKKYEFFFHFILVLHVLLKNPYVRKGNQALGVTITILWIFVHFLRSWASDFCFWLSIFY